MNRGAPEATETMSSRTMHLNDRHHTSSEIAMQTVIFATMRTPHSKFARAVVCLALAGVPCSLLSAATWPSAGCAGTLQACIDAAAVGEVVEIATNGPIAESPQVNDKSLTLRPAPGFTPVFASPESVLVLGGDVAATVLVEGLTITNGRLVAVQGGEGVFDVTFRNNRILDTFTFGSAVEFRSGNTQPPYGPVRFDVSDNEITVDGFAAGDQIGAISIGSFESEASGRVVGNVIRQTGESTQNAVIGVATGINPLTIDVISNDIGGQGFNAGINLFQFSPGGSLTARVINNLVRGGQIDVAGQPGGIGLNSSGGGALSAIVVNNTILNGETGVSVGGRPDLGATLSGVFANNIVAGHSDSGIGIEPGFEATFSNSNNLFFDNGGEFFTPGPGTLFVDPQFVSATDFHLQASSPARNAGDSARVPGDITFDLEGSPRIQGMAVDMGVYEAAPGSALEVPALGGWGLAALAAAIAAGGVVGLGRRRRRA
jgi:hypothetical protein